MSIFHEITARAWDVDFFDDREGGRLTRRDLEWLAASYAGEARLHRRHMIAAQLSGNANRAEIALAARYRALIGARAAMRALVHVGRSRSAPALSIAAE